jgi:hypothetical protein
MHNLTSRRQGAEKRKEKLLSSLGGPWRLGVSGFCSLIDFFTAPEFQRLRSEIAKQDRRNASDKRGMISDR